MKKLYLVSIFIFVFSGCTITKPAITEYRLALKEYSIKDYSSSLRDKSLRVSTAFSSNYLRNNDMNYAKNRYKIYSYSQSQWVSPPNQEISSQILSAIRDAKLFHSVDGEKSRSKSDYVLEINIDDFMQYYSDDLSSSYINIAFYLTLIDAKTNRTIATKAFSAKEGVESLNAAGGVEAFDMALEELIYQALDFISEVKI